MRTFFIFAAACCSVWAQASGDGTTPLHWAVHDGNVTEVERLLKSGANANAKNDFGLTPLAEAVSVNNTAIIKALLDAGANPNDLLADGQTALMVIARSTNVEAAKLLIEVLPAAASVRLMASTFPLKWPASCSSFVPAADSGGTISAVITNCFALILLLRFDMRLLRPFA